MSLTYQKHGSGQGFQNGETLTAADVNKIEDALVAHTSTLNQHDTDIDGKLDKIAGVLESVGIMSEQAVLNLLTDAERAAASELNNDGDNEEDDGEEQEGDGD